MNEGKDIVFFEITVGIEGLRIRKRLGDRVRVKENAEGGVVAVNGALVVPLGLFGEGLQESGWNGEKV